MSNVIFIIIIVLLLIGFSVCFILFRRFYEKKLMHEVMHAQASEHIKSAFLDNISRTLRTPLKAILGYCNLIIEDSEEKMPREQIKEMATHISKNTEQLLGFVTQLMEMSNFEGSVFSFSCVQVNLAELMASYRRECLSFVKPDVSVRLKSDLSPHCKAFIDTHFMHELMMYLLKNASLQTSNGEISIAYSRERKGLKVIISYSGNGQTGLLNEDIFSFLQREDSLMLSTDTTSLGLSMCKTIIDSLGGDLEIDTENNGKKTVASFWFPCKMTDIHKGLE